MEAADGENYIHTLWGRGYIMKDESNDMASAKKDMVEVEK